jgi:predicted site-specific integrase-resolvase
MIVNDVGEDQDELLHDFVVPITSFYVRLYRRRRASRKKTQLLAALEVT